MENLLDKLSSYNVFNYLLPGVVFCVVADKYFSIPLLQDSIIIGLFLYYFIGLVISRFGSLILEPVMKKLKVVEFSDYSDFLEAVKTDAKIEVLSETNNMYRSILSTLTLLCLVFMGEAAIERFPSLSSIFQYLALPIMVVLFGYAYKKQTSYIKKRVDAIKNSSDK